MPGMKGIVVEFVGLPGSGKTTLLREISRDIHISEHIDLVFSSLGRRRVKRTRTIGQLLAFAVGQPLSAASIFWFWARSTSAPFSTFKYVLRLWALLARTEKLGAQAQRKMTILDHGILQSIGSLAVPARSASLQPMPPGLTRLLANRVSGIIWIECPRELAKSRFKRRKNKHSGRFDGYWTREREADLVRFESAIREACVEASKAGVPILTLHADTPTEQNLATAVEWLEPLIGHDDELETSSVVAD